MSRANQSVGSAFQAALVHAERLCADYPRKLTVRIHPELLADGNGGLVVRARIAARHDAELAAQEGKGRREIAFVDLDQEPEKLVRLVEESAAEVKQAVEAAPPPRYRPSKDASIQQEDFNALIDVYYEKITKAVSKELSSDLTKHMPGPLIAEAAMCGALNFAALAALAAEVEAYDVHGCLDESLRELREKAVDRTATIFAPKASMN